MDERFEKVMRALERNQMRPFYVERRAEAVPLVERLLSEGDTVTAGGSTSLAEAGVREHLRCGRYRFLDRDAHGLSEEEIRAIYAQAFGADAYFCSSNAVTENGELYNVDGNANRISAITYGPRQVIMVVGRNKLVKDLDEAVLRVKTVAAPQVCRRRGGKTPCAATGACVSLDGGAAGMASGCDSPGRSCCTFLVSGRQRVKDRIKVILVNEDLGL